MIKYLKYLSPIAIFILMFLSVGFIIGTFDTSTWTTFQRFVFVSGGFIVSFMCWKFYIKNNQNGTN